MKYKYETPTTCDKGHRVRARACSGSHGSCPGKPTETKNCLLTDCPGWLSAIFLSVQIFAFFVSSVFSVSPLSLHYFTDLIIPVTPSQWQRWGEWAQCSTSCGKGTKIRARACNKSDGSCPGEPTDTKYCLVVDCPGCAFCKIPFLSGPSLIIVCLAVSVTDSCCWDFQSVILI